MKKEENSPHWKRFQEEETTVEEGEGIAEP